jgi:hypothetical protein
MLLVPYLVVIAGCGESGPKLVPVSGKVTSKDAPIGGFSLNIQPEAGPVAVAAVSADGTFKTEVVPGKARVFVLVTGQGHDQPNAKIKGVSPKYMEKNSTMEITIPEAGTTDLKIEVGE